MNEKNTGDCSYSCCSAPVSEGLTTGSDLFRLILLAVLLFFLAFYLYQKIHSKKIYWAVTSLVSLLMAALIFNAIQSVQPAKDCGITVIPVTGVLRDTALTSEFLSPDNNFVSLESAKPAKNISPIESEGKKEYSSDTTFVQFDDGFESLDSSFASDVFQNTENPPQGLSQSDKRFLIELAILFSILIIISFFIKNENFRRFRGLFLLGTVAYFGFMKGGCPCMILSFQNLVLAGLGQSVAWISLIWFVSLIPLSYFFGKIWCSWLCHLGGLQEFLFQSNNLHILKSARAQTFLRYFRVAVLAILILQLIITQSNIFIHYDPFKVAFNLFSANTTGYVLLVILLLLSVLIYRPFCRGFCPVGVVLSAVAYLPGAKKITKADTCDKCKRCSDVCKSHAIVFEQGKNRLNVHDCIFCGDCIVKCRNQFNPISR